MRQGRRRCRLPALLALLGACSLLAGACGILGRPAASSSPPPPTSVYNKFVGIEQQAYKTALSDLKGLALPKRAGAPAPSLPPDAFGKGLRSHLVLGFLPSWEIYRASSIDYRALSEVSYFALQVEPGGKILRSGQGWNVLRRGGVGQVVADAHLAGDRALLTLYTGTASTISQMAKAPLAAGTELAAEVAPLLATYHFDGVDLDFESQQGSARAGFTAFVAAFAKALHLRGPHYQIVLNTFPQAAVDPDGLYDVKALARYVNDLFVMAYDMGSTSSPGPTAPLVGLNLTDASVLASYEAVVPARKIILGIPFYGYDFTASGKSPPAVTLGGPVAVTYASIAATGRSALWDPSSQTPYISFKRSGQWHQTWFDDPVSVALKVALAAAFHTAGVGVWELGMAAGRPAMVRALDGGSPPLRLPAAG